MDDAAPTMTPEQPRAPRTVERVARTLAVFGGLVALAVAALVVVSVVRSDSFWL